MFLVPATLFSLPAMLSYRRSLFTLSKVFFFFSAGMDSLHRPRTLRCQTDEELTGSRPSHYNSALLYGLSSFIIRQHLAEIKMKMLQ